jgi:hypothetical protein
MKAATTEEEFDCVRREKTNISSEDLCHGLPPEFGLYWDNVCSLRFEERPKYKVFPTNFS